MYVNCSCPTNRNQWDSYRLLMRQGVLQRSSDVCLQEKWWLSMNSKYFSSWSWLWCSRKSMLPKKALLYGTGDLPSGNGTFFLTATVSAAKQFDLGFLFLDIHGLYLKNRSIFFLFQRLRYWNVEIPQIINAVMLQH